MAAGSSRSSPGSDHALLHRIALLHDVHDAGLRILDDPDAVIFTQRLDRHIDDLVHHLNGISERHRLLVQIGGELVCLEADDPILRRQDHRAAGFRFFIGQIGVDILLYELQRQLKSFPFASGGYLIQLPPVVDRHLKPAMLEGDPLLVGFVVVPYLVHEKHRIHNPGQSSRHHQEPHQAPSPGRLPLRGNSGSYRVIHRFTSSPILALPSIRSQGSSDNLYPILTTKSKNVLLMQQHVHYT
jgi:hypothetical protein